MKNMFLRIAFVIVTIIVFYSCSVTHQGNAFFRIYERIDNGPFDPMFITIKHSGRSFELYSPTMHITTVGTWETRGDTLILSPCLDYTAVNGELYIENPEDSIKTVTSIPMYYLINGNMLLDITDYSQAYPDFVDSERPSPSQYKLMK